MRVAYRAVHDVHRAAIRAFGRAVFSDIKVDLGMRIPLLHTSQGRWAKDAALRVQVGGFEFNGFASSHDVILEETILS